MATLRYVDALSAAAPWRLSQGIESGFSDTGLQLAVYRGELFGVMTSTNNDIWIMKYHEGGFAKFGSAENIRRPTWKIQGRVSVVVFDDRFYIVGRGMNDRVYGCFTTDFQNWTNFQKHPISSLETPVAPTVQAFNNRLYIVATNKDGEMYQIEVNQGGDVIKDWYRVGGVTKLAPCLQVYRDHMILMVIGSRGQDLYMKTMTKTAYEYSSWSVPIRGAGLSGPSAMVHSDNTMWVYWTGENDLIQYSYWDLEKWTGPRPVRGNYAIAEQGSVSWLGKIIVSYGGTKQMNKEAADMMMAKL